MGTKKPLKIDNPLVCLGYAVNLTFTAKEPWKMSGKGTIEVDREIKWQKKDGFELYSNTKGNHLWIIKTSRKNVDKTKFNDSLSKNREKIDKALKLYADWHETDALTGSIMVPPRGFLFRLGRAVSILYSSDKYSGKQRRYIHTFDAPPIVWANSTKSPLAILLTGGKISVKNEGITG